MIFDRIENIGCYKGLSEGVDRSLEFLKEGATEMVAGAVLDLGGGMTARCLSYRPVPYGEGLAEAHRAFIDVMFLREGSELVGYKPANELENITQEYKAENDALLAKEESMALLPFVEGRFAVFFPQDAHMPGIESGAKHESQRTESSELKDVVRIVVKVPVCDAASL